jgi:hypothetical protein
VVGGFYGHLAITSLILLPLALISIPPIQQSLLNNTSLEVNEIVTADLNEQDKERLLQGYYEELVSPMDITSPLQQLEGQEPDEWTNLLEAGGITVTNDMLQRYLKPSVSIIFKSARMTTNQWGMRDKEYTQEKPLNTYRFALVGGSDVMGSGVEDDEVAEAIVEDSLNEYPLAMATGQRIEILNFSVVGYHMMQKVKLMDERVPGFDPDALLYISPQREEFRITNKLPKMLRKGQALEYPFLKNLCDSLGIDMYTSSEEAKRRLMPYTYHIIRWGYQTLVDSCRNKGMVPIWVYMPTLDHPDAHERREFQRLKQLASELGFVIVDLSHLYDGYNYLDLQLADFDRHPNARAHRLIATRLYDELVRVAPQIGLWKARLPSRRVEDVPKVEGE